MTLASTQTLEQLQQENARLLALLGQRESTIQNLQHQLHLFRTARFGRKSEKGVVPEQMALQFDEVYSTTETNTPEVALETPTETITYTRAKKGTGRKALPKSLPYIEHIHDLSDEEKQCACAHARRYFVDVAKAHKKQGLAHQVVALIGKLYQIERELKNKSAAPVLIFMTRLQQSRPILIQIKALLDDAQLKVPPKSPLGTALFYSLTHWQALNLFLYDGRLELDNNLSERVIKPFVIGRKNWLFHGNELGAKAGSILFSLIETCKQNKIETFSWFKYVLTHIRHANSLEQLEQLLLITLSLLCFLICVDYLT